MIIVKIFLYNILYYDIGKGSIRGKVINHFNQGEDAGKIAIELLNGQDKYDIYIGDDSANEYVFDYKVLRKFGIKKSDLPLGSKIINDPIEVVKKYKNIIIGNSILLIGLLITIFVLVCHIRYKRVYEKEILKAKNAAEDMNRANIVKSFVKLHNGTIFVDSKINVGSRFILKFPIKKHQSTSVECINKDELSEKVKMGLSDIYM